MRHSAVYAPDTAASLTAELAADARRCLLAPQKSLPPRWLYDAIGSALFEAICQLPWYRITRAERALLDRVGREIASHTPAVTELVELGPGSGEKLAQLVEAFSGRALSLTAHLVDVSAHALDLASRTLSRFARLHVLTHQVRFEEGLHDIMAAPRDGGRLVLFLGSNIGNFEPDAARRFLAGIACHLRPGDALLLGADLVKPAGELQLAYDDPIGVTAAFNRNVLARLNRELGADFDLRSFAHAARWHAEASRVEMHLVSTRAQRVSIPGAGITVDFTAGESIWTESSYKYEPDTLDALCAAAGLEALEHWVDTQARFALALFARMQ